ncbi:MAG: hypothetical protein JWM90_2405 [Thermoleophilia bacterium]|nr:hypothetical protein [Thermoleophilia bacterium]
MAEARSNDESTEQEGVVIPFPASSKTPPPLPPLQHVHPTPGGGSRFSGSMFGFALAVRDRDAA